MSGLTGFEGLYVNVGLLRDHIVDVAEQKHLAQQLLDKVNLLQRMDAEGPQDQYRILQKKISNLVEYHSRLETTLEEIAEKAVQLSHDIHNAVRSDTDETIDAVNHYLL